MFETADDSISCAQLSLEMCVALRSVTAARKRTSAGGAKVGLSPGAPRGAPEARANLSASGGKGNTAKSKIGSIAPPLLSPASGGAARRLAACGRCFPDSPQHRKIADFSAESRRLH